jgi:hypothetical protein
MNGNFLLLFSVHSFVDFAFVAGGVVLHAVVCSAVVEVVLWFVSMKDIVQLC